MVFICGISYAQDSDPNFRDASWGMSKSEVRKSEEKDLVDEGSEVLRYSDNIIGMDANVIYMFTDNKLTQGGYIFEEDHLNTEDHISDFKKTKRLLKKKYGTPQREGKKWKNDLYKDDREYWGTALTLGHLEYYCIFETEKTKVIAGLQKADAMNIRHAIIYRSLKYKDERQEKEEKENMDDL
jgi:hypothetical protein